jgi:hypothetical protein
VVSSFARQGTVPRPWIGLSIAAAVLAFVGSVIALAVEPIYAGLTPAFLPQAIAQDVGNLCVAAPALVLCAVLARRGSARALMVWLGVLAFTIYNYVIYTFSIPFGPLFPLWAAVLGLSLYAFIGGLISLDGVAIARQFRSDRAVRVSAWVLLVTAGLFGLIWLKEDVPALLTGSVQQSAADLNLPTNPVHILDYVFFLPAAFISGIRLLKKRPFAYPTTIAFLVFLVLTCLPMLITPFVQAARGEAAGWALLGPIGFIAIVMCAAVVWVLSTVRPPNKRVNVTMR